MADAGGVDVPRQGNGEPGKGRGPGEGAWRELRIAPILTGGTSLAVWIGGVSAEIYRVINCLDDDRAGDEVYRALLELTETRAIVDVVTGTSAGGLNGVLLSTAWALRVPTDAVIRLRDLWMDLGDIGSLLRSPNEKNPPSLLKGDDYFWPELTKVLERLASRGTAQPGLVPGLAAPRPRPTDLALTVTTLSGELTQRTDDIGQVLQEARRDHILSFTTGDFGLSPRSDEAWSRRLGLAARTSASIPGVFEASYLPVTDPVGDRPAMGGRASFSVGRWAVDGGVLANQPIGAARERIIAQSVGNELRRVALFVNPTPADARANLADDPQMAPTLANVVAGAISAPKHIGIRHEIDDLRAYNERVRRSVDVGRAIARAMAPISTLPGSTVPVSTETYAGDPLCEMAESLYDQFRHDRAVVSVTTMLDRVGGELNDLAFPRRRVEEALIHAAETTADWLPPTFDLDVGPGWRWGLAPIEYGLGLQLELVRRTYRLPVAMVDHDQRARLGAIRSELHATLDQLRSVRQLDSAFWHGALDRRPEQLFQWAHECYRAWPDAELLPDPHEGDGFVATTANGMRDQITADLWAVAQAMARTAAALSNLVSELSLPIADPTIAEDVHDDVRAVADLISLFRPADGEPADEAAAICRRIVAVHIIAVSLGDTSRRHTEIELVEVSWRAENALDPTRRPDEKLAGVEFSRLGAFVKRSWRANDWMWGRMDGAAQLIRLLLDPRRLRQLGLLPDAVIEVLERVDQRPLDPTERARITAELGYLYPDAHSIVPVPTSLPCTTEAFLRQVQRAIAREELPEVYFAVLRSRQEGAGEGDGGDFRRTFEAATQKGSLVDLDDESVDQLFGRCRIGTETAAAEVGEDMLTRTTGRAALVAANMITGDRSGLSWPARIARPFRQVALLGYVLTQAATTTSRTGMAVTATLSALAGSIVAIFLLSGRTDVGVNSGLVLLAMLILLGGLFLAIVRSGVLAALPGFLALLVVALALIGDGMREVVAGDASFDPDATWRHTVFLGSWPLITVVLIVAGAGWAISAVARFDRARRLHRIVRRQAEARGESPSSMPLRPIVELAAVLVLVPLVLAFHQRVFRYLLIGEDAGWRATLIDLSRWLGDRSVVMVIAGVVVFGVFFGMAWDRTFRVPLVWCRRRLTRLYR